MCVTTTTTTLPVACGMTRMTEALENRRQKMQEMRMHERELHSLNHSLTHSVRAGTSASICFVFSSRLICTRRTLQSGLGQVG